MSIGPSPVRVNRVLTEQLDSGKAGLTLPPHLTSCAGHATTDECRSDASYGPRELCAFPEHRSKEGIHLELMNAGIGCWKPTLSDSFSRADSLSLRLALDSQVYMALR